MSLTTPSRGRTDKLHLQPPSSENSPERTKVWTEPSRKLKLHPSGGRTPPPVPVVYYLSRNGHLEHPHFMEVPLSSPQGLFLKDVINRLNLLRGKGLANHYSWSAKRSYKNGYVWHDLDDHDFIHPVHAREYILKGSEITITEETTTNKSDFPTNVRRRNQSWTSMDLHLSSEKREEELSREEISPPPSDSSPETLESLMKADGRVVVVTSSSSESAEGVDPTDEGVGKISVLMSLISCGSASFRDCGAAVVKDDGEYGVVGKDNDYFSGSLVETTKDLITPPASSFNTSSSYDAARDSQLKVEEVENEEDGVRAKCIPRRAKGVTKKGEFAEKKGNGERDN